MLAAVAAGRLTRDRLKEMPGGYSGGRYVAFPPTCWIGVDMDAWTHFQTSPAWIFFYEEYCQVADVRKALQAWARSTGTELLSFKSAGLATPLHVRAGADEDAVVADLVAQIGAIAKALASSELRRP